MPAARNAKKPSEIIACLALNDPAIVAMLEKNLSKPLWYVKQTADGSDRGWYEQVVACFAGIRGVMSGTDAEKKAKVVTMLKMMRDNGYASRCHDGSVNKISLLTDVLLDSYADKLLDASTPENPSELAEAVKEPVLPRRKNELPIFAPEEVADKIRRFLDRTDMSNNIVIDCVDDIVDTLCDHGKQVHTKSKVSGKFHVMKIAITKGKTSSAKLLRDQDCHPKLKVWTDALFRGSTQGFEARVKEGLSTLTYTDASKDLEQIVTGVVDEWEGEEYLREKLGQDQVKLGHLTSVEKLRLQYVYDSEAGPEQVLKELRGMKRTAGQEERSQLAYYIAEVCYEMRDYLSGQMELMHFLPILQAPIQALILFTIFQIKLGDKPDDVCIGEMFERWNPKSSSAESAKLITELETLESGDGEIDYTWIALLLQDAERGDKADDRVLNSFLVREPYLRR